MRNRLLLLCGFSLFHLFIYSQQLNKAVNDAYLITRMADKFHFQPRALDDEFSGNVFTQLLKQLDEDKLFFTISDVNALAKFRTDIDDQVKNRQSTFLAALIDICSRRLTKVDTMIINICKTPFNFTLAEKITAEEDTTYAAGEKELRIKLYKNIKATAIDAIMDDDRLFMLPSSKQNKYIDSIEPLVRRKIQKSFKHSIDITFQSEGGINEAIGNEYCKAIAACYDPHTEYFPPTEKENFESELGQQSMAFGFEFKEEDDGIVKIENLSPGSPAFKSGQINKGDRIKSIQWEDQQPIDVSDGGLRQLIDALRLSNHDKATLKIQKPDGSERMVVLYKEKQEDDDENKVKSFVLKGSKTIGFISLPAFYQDWEQENSGVNGCANDVAKEILKLKKENIQGLILDLRYNGGGSVQEAVELAGIFIDAGPVAQYKSKEAKIFTLKDINRGSMYDGPLVLLVNGYSASASEMVAGTLQDYNRAVIVGSATYGKATAQVVLPMDTTVADKDYKEKKAESYLKITESQLYRVNGMTAQAKGVQPDIMLPDILDAAPQREADNPHVLISSPIEANKYFKPGPPIAMNDLKVMAKSKVDASPFFTALKNYIDFEKQDRDNKEVNLKLSDVIEEKMKFSKESGDTALLNKETPPYTIQYNSYEKEQLQGNEHLKEMDDQWEKFLSKDPYLQVAYDLVILMK